MSQDASDSSDGTQSGGPATTFNDPLSGTTSTGMYGPTTNGTFTTGNGTAADVAAGPASPNPDTVRTLLDGVFSDGTTADSDWADSGTADSEAGGAVTDGDTAEDVARPGGNGSATTTSVALADGGTPIQPAELPRDGAQPGMLPRRRRTWPIGQRLGRYSLRVRPGFRARTRTTDSSETLRGRRRPSKGTAGVTVAFLLVLLFAFVAIEFVVSFVGMFTGIGS